MGDDGSMFHAVIPAGGSGTRLWPLSRADHPKFLLPLAALSGADARGERPAERVRSLLQATAARLARLVPPERTYVVTGAPHAAAVAAQLPGLPGDNILAEPSPRDSCAAIGLAAAVIARRDPDAVMGSFAADHMIRDEDRFVAAISDAIAGAEQGWLMTIGMRPTHPETGYGYVQCGGIEGSVRRVRRFKEKPDYDLAVKFVESGDYLWNASMFIWRVEVFLAELARQQPELHDGLLRIAAAWDGPDREAVLARVWPGLPRIAVDYAVMEGAAERGRVATVPADFGWSDIGDFHNLADLLPADEHGNTVITDNGQAVLVHDSSGTVVVAKSGRLVSTLGLTDVIIVDTPDALLVVARDRAQEVKQIAEAVRRRGGPC
jgi:mannose-1-phosphate guanylyltransferase